MRSVSSKARWGRDECADMAGTVAMTRLRPHRLLALGLAFLASIPCFFASHAVRAAERPLVIFFGGYGATEEDMRLWQRAAIQDPVYGKIFDFEGVPYPNEAGASVTRAVTAAAGTLDRIAARLRSMPKRQIVVAGHSSGAALAVNTVARVGGGARIKLVSLDAGINTDLPPAPGFFPVTNLECWSATSETERSFGFFRAQAVCKDRFFVLRNDRCLSPICLHFALINRNADPDLTFKQSRELQDGVSRGYADLAINLDWLARSK
jgi:pimeloyl-ACP methyl ester carboxylesterase